MVNVNLILVISIFLLSCEQESDVIDTIYGTWECVGRNMAKEEPPYWSPWTQYYYSYNYLEIK